MYSQLARPSLMPGKNTAPQAFRSPAGRVEEAGVPDFAPSEPGPSGLREQTSNCR
jgi:hypothetical protein